MRLIRSAKGEGPSLVEYYTNAPPFAILSHTWDDPSHEVLYKDLLDDTYRTKAGYQKVWFCREQTARHDLNHFWIDSICIDKQSTVELSEAINSMFRWYQQADICYAYLADVSMSNLSLTNGQDWPQSLKDQFCRSRWFTRDWTLQELLAPSAVKFFSMEGYYLGDKASLESLICSTTGIDARALRGALLNQFPVQKRLYWAKGRETTRPEDMAYSLLGLFGICMPLLYGEGVEAAMHRLLRKIKKRNKRNPLSMIRVGPQESHDLYFEISMSNKPSAWLSLHDFNSTFSTGARTTGSGLLTNRLQGLARSNFVNASLARQQRLYWMGRKVIEVMIHVDVV